MQAVRYYVRSAEFDALFWDFRLSAFGAFGVFGHTRSTLGSEKA